MKGRENRNKTDIHVFDSFGESVDSSRHPKDYNLFLKEEKVSLYVRKKAKWLVVSCKVIRLQQKGLQSPLERMYGWGVFYIMIQRIPIIWADINKCIFSKNRA